jgi:hypothetical protein
MRPTLIVLQAFFRWFTAEALSARAEVEKFEFRNSNFDISLFRIFCEEVFTAEAQSSQRPENF